MRHQTRHFGAVEAYFLPRQWRCGGKRVARGGDTWVSSSVAPTPCHHMHTRSVPGPRCHFLLIPFVGRTEIGISIPSRTRGGGKRGRAAPRGVRPFVLRCYLRILMTVPAPTVRPPSRIAKRRPSSMAIGWIRLTVISVVSPGMTISVPSGSEMTPVTSVVRK